MDLPTPFDTVLGRPPRKTVDEAAAHALKLLTRRGKHEIEIIDDEGNHERLAFDALWRVD
jgi:hypothetical protein